MLKDWKSHADEEYATGDMKWTYTLPDGVLMMNIFAQALILLFTRSKITLAHWVGTI